MEKPPLHPVWDHQRSEDHWEECRRKAAELQAKEEERARQRVNLATLTDGQKRKVWEYIKAHEPALADMLTSPFVKEARAIFEAEAHIDIKIVLAALGRTP